MKSTTTQPWLLSGTLSLLLAPLASAAVTPYSWIRAGEISIFADSSGTNHPFNAAYSGGSPQAGGGSTATILTADTAGGPLGTTGATSTVASIWGGYNNSNNGMWVQGPNNTVPSGALWSLPATNWVMECWMLPIGTGSVRDRGASQFMSTGSSQFGGVPGGAAMRLSSSSNELGETVITVRADSIAPGDNPDGNFTIGTPVEVSTTRWTHLAVVNNNGVTTFYVNGVASGESSTAVTAPSGVPYIGSGGDTGASYRGYLDELRYSTFAAGSFTPADLLLVPPGPVFIKQPVATSVWEGGAAPFEAVTTLDPATTLQWKRDGAAIADATSSELLLPTVGTADNNSVFSAVATNNGLSTTTSNAALTVVAPQTANNVYYRAAVTGEASLQAFFPVDGDTGAAVANAKDGTRPATLAGTASYDGRTNRSYGQRAFRFTGTGEATIPANDAFEFADGTGTIEALVHLENQVSAANRTIFSVAADSASVYYKFQVSPDGNSLFYSNDGGVNASWTSSVSLLGRLAHVALVFTPNKVTAYVDGASLGTKDNLNFGLSSGLPANIGSSGNPGDGAVEGWTGSIDELAIYGDALSANTVAVHNSRFVFGTAVTAPVINDSPAGTTPAGTWNILAGGAPIFRVQASGTAPLTYTWKRNGVPVTGNASASTATFTLNSSEAASGTYTVTVSNDVGAVSSGEYVVNVAAAPTQNYPAYVLADKPTAYWRLNEAEGTTLVDYAGGLNGTTDLSRVDRGRDASFGLAPDTATHYKAAGVSSSVPFSKNLNPSGAFTIEFWAKPDRSGNISRAVLGTQNRNVGRTGYAVYQGFNVNGWEAHLGFNGSVIFLQGTTPPTAGRWDHVVVTWNGSNLSQLYVNGKVESSSTSGPFQPNTAMPLEIGSRFNGSVPYDGTIDEVAFYNYDLSAERVEKHFSVTYVASAITAQPSPVINAPETGTITLSATATGFPNTYQWFKDGEALDNGSLNPDGSRRYSSGVTSPTLVITQGVPGDGGQYQLKVTNGLGASETTPVAVSVQGDASAPTVAYVTASSTFNRVRVGFSKPMTQEDLAVLDNYTFTGGLVATGVTLTNSPATEASVIDIATTGMVSGGKYTLSIAGVRDARLNQNLIAANNTAFAPFVLTPGILTWDYYRGIGGSSISNLLGDGQYPEGVYTTRFLQSFSSFSVTLGGNLSNNPSFGPVLGDNYGARVYGWVTPTETASYRFFLRSDDASELWISSNNSPDPANMTRIAFETGCCDPFKDGDESSTAFELVAGQSYFIEGFYKEGGGGDHIEVAWRKEGDATLPKDLKPIPGTFLSTYAPVLGSMLSPVQVGNQLTISWTGPGILQESSDLATWSDVAGFPASGYSVPLSAVKKFYRVRQ